MGNLRTTRLAKLPIVAGLLAAVLLFLYGIAPITHYRAHLRGSCTGAAVLSASHGHNTELAAVTTSEDPDSCALCVIQATHSVLSAVVVLPSFTDVPLPVYQVRVAAQPLISLFQARRGPPRAPPALV